jgi:hypothetical protein
MQAKKEKKMMVYEQKKLEERNKIKDKGRRIL